MFIQGEKLQMMHSGRHSNSAVYHLALLTDIEGGRQSQLVLQLITLLQQYESRLNGVGHVSRPICHHWINRQAEVNYSTPFMMVTELLHPLHISSQ